MLIKAVTLLLAAVVSSRNEVSTAFTTPTSTSPRPTRLALLLLKAQSSSPNEDDDDEYDVDDDSGLEALTGRVLGINLGAELPSLTPEEIADIRTEVQSTLDDAIDSRLADIEVLREEMQDDLAKSRERIEQAGELNAQLARQSLKEKIDTLSNDFLSSNAEWREGTKRAADADALASSSGQGVDWGSWGTVGGLEVTVKSAGGGASIRPGVLLGSVSAALRFADDAEEELEEFSAVTEVENRVLIVCDEKQDKGSKQIVERLTSLLGDTFDSGIAVDTYSPSSNVPIGGNNAQTAIVFATSLNDRSSLESLLGRILKRTAPVSGGRVGMPPSHVVLVSSIGTERTNSMPYSMQNLFGGKLEKRRGMEEALAAVSRSRRPGVQPPLDYTVVKFGELANSDEGGNDASVVVRAGDSLDGDVGPNAAANVLLQALAYQPYARNSTLCATGKFPGEATVDAATWDDMFLRLYGPELLRVDAGRGRDGNDDAAILDAAYEQLASYVEEWSSTYEGSRKGTGLTTSVLVRRSRKRPSALDGTVARQGMRILFQPTNTGDRYKSATEERKLERKDGVGVSSGEKSSYSPATKFPVRSKRKDGGVEILVEKTTSGDLRVRARRCNMDDKTTVKEMSEEVIVRNLEKAVDIWVKARKV